MPFLDIFYYYDKDVFSYLINNTNILKYFEIKKGKINSPFCYLNKKFKLVDIYIFSHCFKIWNTYIFFI